MLKEHIPVVLINAKAHDCINVLVGGTAHVSAFFKRGGNIELHVSVTFTFCGNVYQVLVILSN